MPMTLRAARVNKGLTQKEAAETLGVSRYTLGNYERGKSFPNVAVINRIEKAYEINYEDIIFLPSNYP